MSQNTEGPDFAGFSDLKELKEQPATWLTQWALHCPLPKAMILVVVPTCGWIIVSFIKYGGSVTAVQLVGIIVLFGMLLGTLLLVCRQGSDGTNCKKPGDSPSQSRNESSSPEAGGESEKEN